MVRGCGCCDAILDHVPVGDLVELIRGYMATMPPDKLNAAIDRTKKFEFSNGLGTHLVIRYECEQLCFARSNGQNLYSRWPVTMCCDVNRVGFLLQDPDMMDVVCTWAREPGRLKEYLARLGLRLDKLLRTCHDE